MFLPSGSEVGFVTFVKSNAKALLSAEPTKMPTVCDCLHSCRGHIGCRRCVSPLATHTQAENNIFACSYGKYDVKLSQHLILPIGNPSFHSVIALTGMCHIPVISLMKNLPTEVRRYTFFIEIFFACFLTLLLCRSSFICCIMLTHYH